MEEAWKDWSSSPQTTQLRALLLIHIWGIWLAKNKVIFLEKSSSPEEVARKGLDILSYFPESKNNPSPRLIVSKQLNKNIPWAFFYGASHVGEEQPYISTNIWHQGWKKSRDLELPNHWAR